MLDEFLKVVAERAKVASSKAHTVELMTRLPKDILRKMASGKIKLGSMCGDDDWIEKYKGSPFLAQAIELEKKEIDAEQEDLVRRQEDEALRRQKDVSRDDTWIARDQIRLEKKLLDLELASAEENGYDGDYGGEEENTPEPSMEEPVEEPPPPPMAVEESNPLPEELKAASMRMRKRAFAFTQKGHELDAKILRAREEGAAKMLAALQDAGAVPYKDDQGRTVGKGLLNRAVQQLSAPIDDPGEVDLRHLAYLRAHHEIGSNPLNPFGGALTPHPTEGPGASWRSYGKVDPSKLEVAGKTAAASTFAQMGRAMLLQNAVEQYKEAGVFSPFAKLVTKAPKVISKGFNTGLTGKAISAVGEEAAAAAKPGLGAATQNFGTYMKDWVKKNPFHATAGAGVLGLGAGIAGTKLIEGDRR
jgi:hypothetical protein